MFQRLIVPLDGSTCAERAIPVAARLARASGGSIVFVRVVLPPVDPGKYAKHRTEMWERVAYETERAQAASYLVGMMLTYANDLAGIDIDLEVASGLAAPTICLAARLEHADLIVMCSHGETGLKRWLFGSVAQETARQSPVPVLVLKERGAALPVPCAAYPLRVLVALNGSPLSEKALSPAVELLAALAIQAQGTLHLLRVVTLPATVGKWRSQAHVSTMMREQARQEAETYLRKVAQRLQAEAPASLKLTVTTSVAINTDVAGTRFKLAEHSDSAEQMDGCDLIVLATNRHGTLRHIVSGSIPEKVLGSARLPLLVVRPHETPAQVSVRKNKATFF